MSRTTFAAQQSLKMGCFSLPVALLAIGLSYDLLASVDATLGLDLSTSTSESAFSCLKGKGYDFVIVRAYQSYGQPDPAASKTISNARAAGFDLVDVYMFPCPKCSKSAKDQVSDMVRSLNVSYGQIWLDIEGSQYWHSTKEDNQKFFEELVTAASFHKRTGVYASEYQWSSIMGSDYSGGSSHQLWYAHYDNNPSFSDFRPFGGWNKPAIKQFAGDKSVCGAGIDENYY